MRPIVEVRNLSKSYRITQIAQADGQGAERDKVIWALRNVSFEVFPGEVVGIVGRNGAGKSTLLKILSRIVRPTTGEADIYGRLGSLLEIGTGFHPDLTGRENVYLNGAIIGMRRDEIKRKFDEIVAFSEIEEFLDTPVKHYSSGMQVRLAFSVAAHFEPEILVLDEVLAVGDAAFRQKCFRKMQDVIREGRTIFFVSHDSSSVLRLCERVLLIQSGCLTDDGPAATVVKRYLDVAGVSS
jgi:lipopolysaccharide transport system ATP-binding protein